MLSLLDRIIRLEAKICECCDEASPDIGCYISITAGLTADPSENLSSDQIDCGEGIHFYSPDLSITPSIEPGGVVSLTGYAGFTYNAGTTASIIDASLGGTIINTGETIHLYSSDSSVGITINPNGSTDLVVAMADCSWALTAGNDDNYLEHERGEDDVECGDQVHLFSSDSTIDIIVDPSTPGVSLVDLTITPSVIEGLQLDVQLDYPSPPPFSPDMSLHPDYPDFTNKLITDYYQSEGIIDFEGNAAITSAMYNKTAWVNIKGGNMARIGSPNYPFSSPTAARQAFIDEGIIGGTIIVHPGEYWYTNLPGVPPGMPGFGATLVTNVDAEGINLMFDGQYIFLEGAKVVWYINGDSTTQDLVPFSDVELALLENENYKCAVHGGIFEMNVISTEVTPSYEHWSFLVLLKEYSEIYFYDFRRIQLFGPVTGIEYSNPAEIGVGLYGTNVYFFRGKEILCVGGSATFFGTCDADSHSLGVSVDEVPVNHQGARNPAILYVEAELYRNQGGTLFGLEFYDYFRGFDKFRIFIKLNRWECYRENIALYVAGLTNASLFVDVKHLYTYNGTVFDISNANSGSDINIKLGKWEHAINGSSSLPAVVIQDDSTVTTFRVNFHADEALINTDNLLFQVHTETTPTISSMSCNGNLTISGKYVIPDDSIVATTTILSFSHNTTFYMFLKDCTFVDKRSNNVGATEWITTPHLFVYPTVVIQNVCTNLEPPIVAIVFWGDTPVLDTNFTNIYF